ncbi:helix-turn-helix domain-containing protein [Achromobacter xylosoxidans]|uniref:helix-turn-helix domain-containing protein n=1 Tax=Alcaligenes xylosoxydans xylosoxydans TaxID=85698 RepID=UPI002E18DE2E|nr:helix-turn-helix domain-containing protein [Achromobacter xylosoxidans]
MNSEFLLLAKYQKPRLSLAELADFLGVSLHRAQNMKSAGELPVPVYKEGRNVYCDLRDVAAYLDAMRECARRDHEATRV